MPITSSFIDSALIFKERDHGRLNVFEIKSGQFYLIKKMCKMYIYRVGAEERGLNRQKNGRVGTYLIDNRYRVQQASETCLSQYHEQPVFTIDARILFSTS